MIDLLTTVASVLFSSLLSLQNISFCLRLVVVDSDCALASYRVFLVKEDKKKRHISASREARMIRKIALKSPVIAIFVYKKFRTLSRKVLGLQCHEPNTTGWKINQIFVLHF